MKQALVKTGVWAVTGALVLLVMGSIVVTALQRARRHDVPAAAAPISPEAEQQALDRTAQRLFAMDDCAHLGICGRDTFDDPLRTIEKVWSSDRVLYVQVRPAPWAEAGAARREHAVDQMMAIWVQELLSAGIWGFSDRDSTRVVVLDKQQTVIVCAGGKVDPNDPSTFYGCRR
jgi:hypothetical protein